MHKLLLLTLGVLLSVPVIWAFGEPEAKNESELAVNAGTEPSNSPRATDPFASTLIRAGLSFEAMAAAGVTPASVDALLGQCRQASDASATPLAGIDTTIAQCRPDMDRLRRKIASGVSSAGEVQEFQALKAQFEAAMSSRGAALDEIRSGVAATLSEAQMATLRTIHVNRRWKFPAEYLVVERTDAEWVRLRDCMGEERVAPELGDTPSQACQDFLASVRGEAAVVQARANLDTNAAGVELAWNTSLSR